MKQLVLKAKKRQETGTSKSGQMRAAGRIPAVIYGHGGAASLISLDATEFNRFLSHHASTSIVTLSFEDGSSADRTAMIKTIQKDPVKRSVNHIDFQEILLSEKVTVRVPLVVVGRAKNDGGVLEHLMNEVAIEVTASSIPAHIEVNIDGLGIGDAVHVKELVLPEGARILEHADQAVIAIAAPRSVATEQPVVEAETAEPEVVSKEKKAEE